MKRIFEGEVYEVLPLSNGIIFSYCKEVLEKNIVVAYKMLSFETGAITDVAKNIYLLTKFGSGYKAVVNYCDNYITVKSLALLGGKVFLLATDGSAQLLDDDATPIWTGTLTYRSSTPSDIVLYNNVLWASYSECNVLVRYNLSTMREELRLGGSRSPFNKPKNLFLEGDVVTVCNGGSKSIVNVNLNTYAVEEVATFEEPVWQYIKSGDYSFVVLESGLYLI